jgi:hypothetical protein
LRQEGRAVLYFFLSYARGTDDALVQQFYHDLCDELRRRTGAAAGEQVGFLDTRIGIGVRWSAALQRALASCQVFLPLYSPRYFRRPNCAMEWAFFTERLRRNGGRAGAEPSSIVPVTWVPLRELPPAAAAINYHDDAFGVEYARKGLYGIIRVRRLEDDYYEFLSELAARIIEVVRLQPLAELDDAASRDIEALAETAAPWPLPPEAPELAAPAAPATVAAVPDASDPPPANPGYPPAGGYPAAGADPPARAHPSVWNVPTRSVGFTGREPMLDRLRRGLSAGTTVVLPHTLFGLGGVGKTQLAIEYAHRFAAEYELVWWVPAEQPALIRSTLAELAPLLRVPSGEKVAETAVAVLDALRRGQPYRRWLLVFDNAEEPGELLRYLPQGAGHVLVTSRNQDWASHFDHVEVDVFTRLESVALLTRRCPGLDPADANRIAEALGDLPLAVGQAGAWLDSTGMSVEVYLKLLQTEIAQLLAASVPAGYPRSAAATWLVSLGRLAREEPAAAALLRLCAFFAPEPIPLSVLYGDAMVSLLAPEDTTVHGPILLGRLIRGIGRYALARVDQRQGTFQIHRLVQAVLRDQLTPQQQAEARHQVHEVLAHANPGAPDEPRNWPRYAELFAHLTPSEAIDCPAGPVRQLVVDEARYLWRRGDFGSSQALAEQALPRWRERFGPDDPSTLLLGFQLANALRSQARYEAAWQLDADLLARMRRTLGDDHHYTLMTSSSLAADVRALGRYQQACELDRNALGRFRAVLGEDHPRTLMVANNLAESLYTAGDPAAARALHQETLERSRRVRGPDHPSTLFVASNLARDLRGEGELAASAALQQATLARYRQVLGEGHASTLHAAANLAVSLRKLGRVAAARNLNDDALRRYRALLGDEHPDTLACAMNLAGDRCAAGDVLGALELAEDVFVRYRQVLGEHHPSTLACASNLVAVLRANQAGARARMLAERTLAVLPGVVGDDHPYTLACTVNLANTVYDMGDADGALGLDEPAYRRYRAVRGVHHPETLASGNNLSVDLRGVNATGAGVALHDDMLRRFREVLGDAHQDTARVIGWQRLDCDVEVPPV